MDGFLREGAIEAGGGVGGKEVQLDELLLEEDDVTTLLATEERMWQRGER